MSDTDLFATLEDLKPFVFRITDNGGQSADRFTVVTCDGDYYGMSTNPFHPQGVGMTGEGIDLQWLDERTAAGLDRDLRWIDLPEACRRCVHDGLNDGFRDYVKAAAAAPDRASALSYEGWRELQATARENGHNGGPVECIYVDGDAFRIRNDDRMETEGEDPGPYATFREAVLSILPDQHDLSGPEYHVEIDMWDETGGPAPLWDRDVDPPVLDDESTLAKFELVGPAGAKLGRFFEEDDAYAQIAKLQRQADGEERTFVRAAYAVVDLAKTS